MHRKSTVVGGLLAVSAALASTPASAQRLAKPSGTQNLQQATMNDVPRCARKLGTVSVMDGDDPSGWTQFQLAGPQKLLKALIQRSGSIWSIEARGLARRSASATSAAISGSSDARMSARARSRRPIMC